jgi:hypothetical protein
LPCKIPRSTHLFQESGSGEAHNGEAKAKPVASPWQASEFSRSDITAPPKPLAQTKVLLDQMSRSQEDDKNKWDQVMDNFDLLFTRMNDIGIIQQDLKNQLTAK